MRDKKDNITNLNDFQPDNEGKPYTEEQLKNMTEDELNDVLASPVTKGEVIQLVRNLVGLELDAFQKFIGEPLRVVSIQNLALIKLAQDKGLIKEESDLTPYMEEVRKELQEEYEEENGQENEESTGKET